MTGTMMMNIDRDITNALGRLIPIIAIDTFLRGGGLGLGS